MIFAIAEFEQPLKSHRLAREMMDRELQNLIQQRETTSNEINCAIADIEKLEGELAAVQTQKSIAVALDIIAIQIQKTGSAKAFTA